MIPGNLLRPSHPPQAKPDRDGRQRQAEQQTEQNIHRIVHAQIDPAVRQQGRPYENGYGIPPPAEQHGSEQRDREADGRMGGNRAVQPAPVVPDRMGTSDSTSGVWVGRSFGTLCLKKLHIWSSAMTVAPRNKHDPTADRAFRTASTRHTAARHTTGSK